MTAKKDDAGADQVQAKVDEETDTGVNGTKVDPVPDEAYSLLTGPDSPPTFADDATRSAMHPLVKEG